MIDSVRFRFALSALLLTACAQPSQENAAPKRSPDPLSSPANGDATATARALATAIPSDDADIQTAARDVKALAQKPESWVTLGQAWVKRARRTGDPGYYLNADACATVALALAPEFRGALDLRLLVFLNGHRFGEARDLARQVLARAPDDALAHGALSDALLELGDVSGAEAAIQRMLDIKPDLPAYSRVSYMRWLSGDIEGAKLAIAQAYDAGRGAKDPEPATWTLVQAALIFWHAGDAEGALAGLEIAERSLPDYPPALALRGRALLSLGRAPEAVASLRRSLERAPLSDTAWHLSQALAAANDAPGATAAFERAITLGRQIDRLTLAQILASQARSPAEVAEAVRAARQEASQRGGPYIDDALAFALFRTGTTEALAEARTLIDRAIAVGLPDARVIAHAGLIRAATGDVTGARALLERATTLKTTLERKLLDEIGGALGGLK